MRSLALTGLCVLMAAGLLTPVAAAAAALPDIPVEVQERAGVDRANNQVVGGIPLPMGAVAEVNSLILVAKDAPDKPLPATFVVREKWLNDNSVRWATVHFLASLPANGKAEYVVKQAKAGEAMPTIAQGDANRATVDTGVVKFVVTKDHFNVIDQLWFDPAGKGKYGPPVIEPGAAKLKVNLQNGKYKVDNKKALLDVIGDAADVTAKVDKLELEENAGGRAVVKVTGQFMDKTTPTLDFVARIYAQAGSGSVRASFTVINKTGKTWSDFWGINELTLDVPVKLAGALKYSISNSTGDDAAGAIKGGEAASILQPYSEDYTLGGIAKGAGKAKSLLTRRLGWADLTGSDAGVTVGIRNFWQMHPKGLAVTGEGVLSIQIVPKQEKAVEVPKGVVSQAQTRMDLFTAGARTHEFLIAVHGPADKPRAIAMGIVDPLLAAAKTAWYCQGSRAEGPLFDSNPDNFKPEYRELIATYQKHISQVQEEAAGKDRRAGKRGTEEYGFFSYGAGTEAKEYITPNDWLNTRWDGNYYDFPRANMVNFWRTGELKSWDLAQDSGLHLADVDICHSNPTDAKLAGIERMCPARGHFRIWSADEHFGPSGNMDSTKSQSLYDLYHMTGDAWYLDTALLVSNYCMNHTGGALRAIGNRAKGLICAYEQTGDKKYLDEAGKWLDKMLSPRTPQQKWDQSWMYGLATEALTDMYRLTGEDKWTKTAVNCCDSLINNYWKDDAGAAPLCGFTTNCFGAAYELTGNADYLKKGLVQFEKAATEYTGGVKTFAQEFRISPYFLVYLSKDYKLPPPAVKK